MTTIADPFGTLTFGKDQSSLLGTTDAPTNIFAQYGAALGIGTTNQSPNLATPATDAAAPTPTTQTTSAPATGGLDLGDLFGRGIIVILGFIFVGIGLSMFKPGLISAPRV